MDFKYTLRRMLQRSSQPPPNQHSTTTTGLLTTLLVSFVAWIAIQSVFEFNRFYKQIYLKRLQRRFQVYFYNYLRKINESIANFCLL